MHIIFSICNVLSRIIKDNYNNNNLEKIKEHLEFIDFLSKHSVNNENIDKIFSNDNAAFGKKKDQNNRKFLELLLQHQTIYNIDKIKEIFSFKEDIFNKMTVNLELVKHILKHNFDIPNIEYCFSSNNSCFDKIKEIGEPVIQYLKEHNFNLSDIKDIDGNDDLSITFTVPSSKLNNPSAIGLEEPSYARNP